MTRAQISDEFKSFVDRNGMSEATVNKFLSLKRAENADMREVICAMKSYAWSEGVRDELFISELIILKDKGKAQTTGCHGVMGKLSKETKKKYSKEIWEKIFGGLNIPEAGSTLEEMSDFTVELENKFISVTSREDFECAIKKGSPFAKSFKPEAKKDLGLEEIDAFIKKWSDNDLRMLRRYVKSGSLFFNQILTAAAIEEFALPKWRPRREGSKIIFYQIPFLFDKYLAETDNKMKRYYACHCPWARKSILKEQSVSKSFCYCSFNHGKQWIENEFGRELDGRVISSVLEEGSEQCVFEVDIPDDIMNKAEINL